MSLVACGCLAITGSALASSDGTLDRHFAQGGVALLNFFERTPLKGTLDSAHAVAIQDDGRILVAGTTADEDFDFALARYMPSGLLDPTFGSGGRVVTDASGGIYPGEGDDEIKDLTIQPDGRIIVAGYSTHVDNSDPDWPSFSWELTLARYNPDGSLDSSFGDSGLVKTRFAGHADHEAHAVELQPDGRIVAAGYSATGAVHDFALARYNPDGTLDPSFSGDGRRLLNMSQTPDGLDFISDLAIQADGKIVAVGNADSRVDDSRTRSDIAVARFNPHGSLDSSFSGNGRLRRNLFGGDHFAGSVAIRGDGTIFVGGDAKRGDHCSDLVVVALTPTGVPHSSFGSNGIVATDVTECDLGRALALQDDGRVILAGGSSDWDSVSFTLVRYTAGGDLDTSFAGDGVLVTELDRAPRSLAGRLTIALDLALDGQGRVVAVGRSKPDGVWSAFTTVRYTNACDLARRAVTKAKRKLRGLRQKTKRARVKRRKLVRKLKRLPGSSRSTAKRKLRRKVRRASRRVKQRKRAVKAARRAVRRADREAAAACG